MDRPAASSAARLIRRPLDSFSSDLDIALSETERFRYAFIAETFELMRRLMVCSSVNCVLVPVRGLPDDSSSGPAQG